MISSGSIGPSAAGPAYNIYCLIYRVLTTRRVFLLGNNWTVDSQHPDEHSHERILPENVHDKSALNCRLSARRTDIVEAEEFARDGLDQGPRVRRGLIFLTRQIDSTYSASW